jgi:hypothetical protein
VHSVSSGTGSLDQVEASLQRFERLSHGTVSPRTTAWPGARTWPGLRVERETQAVAPKAECRSCGGADDPREGRHVGSL